MVNNTNSKRLQCAIVNTRLGPNTGDEEHQTCDGNWWQKWDGTVRTGQEVRTLHREE